MAEKTIRADLNLHGSEIKNFAVHNVANLTTDGVADGQLVYNDGKLYVWNEETSAWVEQGDASSIEQVASDLSDEVTRATGAEETLQGNINAEELARQTADGVLDGKIDDEVTRATGAEQTIAGDLSDEVTRATNAEGVLDGKIDAEEAARVAADNTKVDKEISGSNGTAKIFNEVDGGGVQYDSASSSGDTVFVGVHGDSSVGEFVSVYAKDKSDSSNTKRVIVKTDGAYYLKSNSITTTSSDEIATAGSVASYTYDKSTIDSKIAEKDSLPSQAGNSGKFLTTDGTDASWANLPVYSIAKDAQAETGYAHTYHLTKDGVNVGASINIPKDMVVESGTVETCVQDDVPVQGYVVGDKYIDLVLANTAQNHLYILVSDLIDVYQGSTYIDIVNNTISLKYSDLETKLQDTFYTETEVDGFVTTLEAADTALDTAKADKATTLAGYGITDAYTKTEVDSIISGKKQVVSCPALTASGSQFTWTFSNTVGADAVVSVYESGAEVIADVTVTASTITITMNQTADLQSITAGQFKAVVLG